MIEPRWIVKRGTLENIPSDLQNLPRIVLQLLSSRKRWEKEELQNFLTPRLKHLTDPNLIGEVPEAVELIFQAIDEGSVITLFGDYDVDGITSLTLMTKVLEAYGVIPNFIIPNRGSEGYGMTEKAMQRCLQSYPETELLIAMDCGTSSLEEVEMLKAKGIKVLILDHHESNTGARPQADVVVNPKACFTPNVAGQYDYLCAAGVVFKVCHALLKKRQLDHVSLKDLLDYVAIATVADIVPLVAENRILVKHGLKALGNTDKPGLKALKDVAGVGDEPEASDIGFKIGPRINAAGRMDAPLEALEMLLTDDQQRADALVGRLNRYNADRQAYEKQIQAEALEQVEQEQLQNDHCIIVAKRGWHPGVVGIVASRLMRKFFKPAFVVAIDENGAGKGSGRSLNDISLVGAIDASRDLLLAGGGHHAAAGMALEETNIGAFRASVQEYMEAETTAEQRYPKVRIDADVDFSELSFAFMDSYDKLKPFGTENPQPVFMTRGVSLARPPRELKNQHLKLTLAQKGVERDAIFFGGGAIELPAEPWDVSYTVDRNEFRGQVSLQITVQRVRASQ